MQPFILFLWITGFDGTVATERKMPSQAVCEDTGRAIATKMRQTGFASVVWACVSRKPETAL